MAPSPSTEQDLYLPEDDLFVRLGAELLGEGRGLGGDADRHRDFGRSWFARWAEENRRILCDDPRVVALSVDATPAEELAVVADVIAGIVGAPPVATLAVIVAKRGLVRFCRSDRSLGE